jgi:hypothetical protein
VTTGGSIHNEHQQLCGYVHVTQEAHEIFCGGVSDSDCAYMIQLVSARFILDSFRPLRISLICTLTKPLYAETGRMPWKDRSTALDWFGRKHA